MFTKPIIDITLFWQIPDKVLEHRPREKVIQRDDEEISSSSSSSTQSRPDEDHDDDDDENYIIHEVHDTISDKGGQIMNNNGRPIPRRPGRPRRLSMYEDGDSVMDPENASGKSLVSRSPRSFRPRVVVNRDPTSQLGSFGSVNGQWQR